MTLLFLFQQSSTPEPDADSMGTIRTLRDNLHTLLKTIPDVSFVSKYPTLNLEGFPGSFIKGMGNDADFWTVELNKRVYNFDVWMFQEYKQTGAQEGYDIIYDVIDQVLDKVDSQNNPDTPSMSLGNDLPSGKTLLRVSAAFSDVLDDDQNKILFTAIKVKCMVTVDVTLLT